MAELLKSLKVEDTPVYSKQMDETPKALPCFVCGGSADPDLVNMCYADFETFVKIKTERWLRQSRATLEALKSRRERVA